MNDVKIPELLIPVVEDNRSLRKKINGITAENAALKEQVKRLMAPVSQREWIQHAQSSREQMPIICAQIATKILAERGKEKL